MHAYMQCSSWETCSFYSYAIASIWRAKHQRGCQLQPEAPVHLRLVTLVIRKQVLRMPVATTNFPAIAPEKLASLAIIVRLSDTCMMHLSMRRCCLNNHI